MEPDLTPSRTWLAGRTPRQRKATGQWVTPYWICAAVIARLAPDLPEAPRIVDPACGDGRWLVAAARRLPGARLVGYDSDPAAIEAAHDTLDRAGVRATLVCADALAEGALPRCDAMVGNPPFVRPQHLPRAQARDLWRRFGVATDKCDLYACFVERALDRAPRVAFVLGDTFLSMASFAALRDRIVAAGVDGVWRLPPRTFTATIDAVVLIAAPTDRRGAGRLSPRGFDTDETLHVGSTGWSLDGPPPDLPGVPLGDLATLHMGVVCGDYPRYVHEGRRYPEDRPTCRGRDVQRWRIRPGDLYVRYLPRDMLARKPYVAPKHSGIFDVPEKVVLAGATGRRLVAAMDRDARFVLDSCYVIHPKYGDDPYGILGLLLSTPVQRWYGARFPAARVKGIEVAKIPVPPPPWTEIARAARAEDDDALDRAAHAAYAAI